jgi:hypothetical protein
MVNDFTVQRWAMASIAPKTTNVALAARFTASPPRSELSQCFARLADSA